MSRSNAHQPDYVLLGIVAFLLLFGLVMLSSAGAVLGFQRFGDSNYFLKKQVLSVIVGAVAFFFAYRMDYHFWQKWAVPLMIGTIVLLVLVFLPGIGSYFLGARRWIQLGPALFQPSELAKLTFIFYLASWFERRVGTLHHVHESLLPFTVTVGIMAVLLLAQPDLGTALVLLAIALGLYFLAGGPWKYILGFIGAGLGFLLLVIKFAPYRAQRFTVFLNPDLDPLGIGYHINQAWIAIGSGGIFGLGLGRSRQKFNYLPEPAGDSIFAVTAEELGFLFSILFISAWVFFIIRGLRIASQAPDTFGRLVAGGIVTWLGLQAFINMAALSGLLPLTGIPLPFMSHGGSAIIVSMAAVGVLLNISRYSSHSLRRR